MRKVKFLDVQGFCCDTKEKEGQRINDTLRALHELGFIIIDIKFTSTQDGDVSTCIIVYDDVTD